MKTLSRSLVALLAATAATPALAKSDTQYWQTLAVNTKLSDDVVMQNETVIRSGDARGFYEIENTLLVGYKLDKNVTVFAGWVANPLYNKGAYNTMENRFRTQVTFDRLLMIGKARLGGRLRLEGRWRDGLAGNAWRLRPQVKLSVPVHGKTSVNIAHESFIDLNTTGFQKVGGLERMRNSISVSTPIARRISLEVGYLEQHGFVPTGEDTGDHVATIQLSASF